MKGYVRDIVSYLCRPLLGTWYAIKAQPCTTVPVEMLGVLKAFAPFPSTEYAFDGSCSCTPERATSWLYLSLNTQ